MQTARDLPPNCWCQAVRPAYEVVPPSANGVWFADVAEWLACLSWDIHQGVATKRWWWQTWLRSHLSSGIGETLWKLWQKEVQWLPQMFEIFYQRYGIGIESLLARLTPPQAEILWQLVAQTYQLPVRSAPEIIDYLEPFLPTSVRMIIGELPQQTQALAALCLGIVHTPTVLQQYRREPGRAIAEGGTLNVDQSKEIDGTVKVGNDETTKVNNSLQIDHDEATKVDQSVKMDSVTPVDAPIQAKTGPDVTHASPGKVETQPDIPAMVVVPTSQLEQVKPALKTPNSQEADSLSLSHRTRLEVDPLVAENESNQLEPSPVAVPWTQKDLNSLILAAEQGIQTKVGGLWYLVNMLIDLDWLTDAEVKSLA